MPDDTNMPDPHDQSHRGEDPTRDDVTRDDQTLEPTIEQAHSDFEMPSGTGSDPNAPGGTVSVPEQIGPYRVTGVIGYGGMGAVYEAIQESPKRRVALKVVKPGWLTEPVLRRFAFEAQVLGRLRHPNIAQIYEAGTFTDQFGERPYFAMEYIPGAQMITEYVRRSNLTMEERLRLFTKVCDAVHHGHQKGVIHRDLKPENILVDSAGNPKIIDFGVARATDADAAIRTMQTSLGQIVGTLQYMSPEQCSGEPANLDTRTDVYSLGMIFYEVLCDRLPYDLTKRAIDEAMRVIREELPRRPSTITRVIRGDLETISLKALEKVRDRRYDSAASFGRDIQRYLDNEPIDARRASMGYHLLMFSRRNRGTVVSAATIILAITVGLVLAIVAWSESDSLNQQLQATNTQLEAKTEESEQRLLANRQLAKQTLEGTYTQLRRMDGSIQTRAIMARGVLDYLNSLDESTRTAEDIKILARAHQDLAQALGGQREGSLGQHDEALEHLRSAEALWAEAADEDPGNLGLRQMRARAQRRIALMHTSAEAYFDAMNILTPLAASLETLCQDERDHVATYRLLVAVYQDISDVRDAMGDRSMARAALVKADGILVAGLQRYPGSTSLREDAAQLARRIGYALRAEDPQKALDKQVEALALFTALAEADDSNAEAQHNLGWGHYYVAKAAADTDQREMALDHLGRGWSIIVVQCSRNPSSAQAREVVLVYLDELVVLHEYLKATETLPTRCREAVLVLQPTVEANPDNIALGDVMDRILVVMRGATTAAGS
ncbi:MAG: serine/threonine protein kinase [Phycisphaerales bacterium]|nr:serine/threonine protein kinase [Phycisphaerales bacterium]